MVTTTLALVIITTLLFGTFMPLVQKILVPPEIEEDLSSAVTSVEEEHEADEDHYEEIVHPNMENEQDTESQGAAKKLRASNIKGDVPKTCGYYMSTLDNMIIRPMLIYKYTQEGINNVDDIMEMIANDQNMLNEVYAKLGPQNSLKSQMSSRSKLSK